MVRTEKAAPVRKVTATGITGAVAVIVLWILESQGIVVPVPVAAAIQTIVMFAVAYLVPPAADDGIVVTGDGIPATP